MQETDKHKARTDYRTAADNYVSAKDALEIACASSDGDVAETAAEAFLEAETAYLAAKAEMTRLQAWARDHWNAM